MLDHSSSRLHDRAQFNVFSLAGTPHSSKLIPSHSQVFGDRSLAEHEVVGELAAQLAAAGETGALPSTPDPGLWFNFQAMQYLLYAKHHMLFPTLNHWVPEVSVCTDQCRQPPHLRAPCGT